MIKPGTTLKLFKGRYSAGCGVLFRGNLYVAPQVGDNVIFLGVSETEYHQANPVPGATLVVKFLYKGKLHESAMVFHDRKEALGHLADFMEVVR